MINLPALVEVLVVLGGWPFLLAAIPGFVVLRKKRWVLSATLLSGALLTIALPFSAEIMASLETPPGVIRDNFSFRYMLWFYGASYALAACIGLAVLRLFRAH